MSTTNKLKILMVASEVAPFVKSGGLGDVIGSLPKEMIKQGLDVRVACPKYKTIKEEHLKQIQYIKSIETNMGWRNQHFHIHKIEEDFPLYLIENEYYFGRDGMYGYGDDFERFAFFSKVCIEMLSEIDFIPDIINFNDWQTGIGSVYLKDNFAGFLPYAKIKTVFTIHNLQYQGVFGREILGNIDLNDGYFTEDKIKFYDMISMMKAGIVYADAVNTVSETYSNEIQTMQYGYGMDQILKNYSYKLRGILNGIDNVVYDPKNDKDIAFNYDKDTIKIKKKNKKQIQKELNLPIEDVPVISIISRLVDQKGLDLLYYGMEELLQKNIQIIILGTGEHRYESAFKNFANNNPLKVSCNIHFDENLAKKIYAGSDMFLMPSLFEPCGLGQLFAMRYGSVPIVRKTGGLADTVEHYNFDTKEGNGFVFENYDTNGLLWAINKAIEAYYTDDFETIIYNGMSKDFSWAKPSKKYIEMYSWLKDTTK
jgi:starch synthase